MRKRTTTVALLAGMAVLALADAASAYYSPRLGRFLNRDPLNEKGAVLVRKTASTGFLPRDPVYSTAQKQPSQNDRNASEQNLYGFVDNDPVDSVDLLGLDRWIIRGGEGGILGKGHSAVIYQAEGGCYRIEIKMQINKFYQWWHWPKDLVQLGLNTCLCGTVGGFGEVQKSRVSCPKTPPDIKTSPEEDAALHSKWENGDLVYYNLWLRNCNTFTATEQNYGTGHGWGGGSPKPVSSPGPCTRTVPKCTLERLADLANVVQ